jgi:phosphate transport system permease protein
VSSEVPDLQQDDGWQWLRESAYGGLFVVCAAVSVLTTVGIVLTLFVDASAFFAEYSIVAFLT